MRPSSQSAPDCHGGVLLLVLPVVALLLMLVLSGATTVQLRWRLARDTLDRQQARDAARSGVAQATQRLAADTNAVDSLDEPWATDERWNLIDEESRINLLTAAAPLLAALFEQAAGLPHSQAKTLAQAVLTWREAQSPPPPTLALFAFAPGMDAAIVARIAPYATVHGLGRINLNTTDDTVLRMLLDSAGTPRDATETMLAAFRAARRHGIVCATLDAQSLSTVFVGPRRIPGPAQAQALGAIAPLLDVRSTTFHGVTVGTPPHADLPRHEIAFTYHRPTGTFRQWVE